MKKWRMIWGAVILAGMLGGCQAKELPEDPLTLYEDWFGKSESRMVRTFGMTEEEWTEEERDEKQGSADGWIEYHVSLYKYTAEAENGGTLEAEFRFFDGVGLDGFVYRGTGLATDRESFYQDVMAAYKRCVELFGEPAMSTDEKIESMQQYYIAWPPGNSLMAPPQTEGLDWTEYGDIDSFYQTTSSQYQKNSGQPAPYQLRSYWWDASEKMPFTRVDVRIDYHNPDSENMMFDYYFTCRSDTIGWEQYEAEMRVREEAGHETNAE